MSLHYLVSMIPNHRAIVLDSRPTDGYFGWRRTRNISTWYAVILGRHVHVVEEVLLAAEAVQPGEEGALGHASPPSQMRP